MTTFALKARYVFPVAGRPIANGAVTIDGRQIVAVGQPRDDGETHDLGNVAILPGLVNAHTHLDFSDLVKPLGERGIGLVDWIRRVIEYRRRATNASSPEAVTIGLDESIRGGVTTIGDIAQPGWNMTTESANVTVFRELIAPTAARVAGAMELAKSHLHMNINSRGLTAPGENVHNSHASRGLLAPGYYDNCQLAFSPHSPYSVHCELLRAVIALSAAERIPLAMHLAESREELELLRHGTGPLREFLEEIGAWDATAIPSGSRPIDYLRHLALAHRALVIHGNYLENDEIAFLAANAERMSVVYCPRTHDWFAHRAYPLEKMLAAGVTVALGTDGRGSSPDLSLLAEMRFAAGWHPTVRLDRILRLGTVLGAKALGREQYIGTLEPGKQADLAIVGLPDRDATDPHELLFASEEPIVGRYFRGVKIFAGRSL